MKKNCAFTIVAKNYIGLARILENSIKKYFLDFDFYIIIADEIDDQLRADLNSNILVAKYTLGIDSTTWNNMSFKYNLTEFCTSIKPASFRYLFDNYDYDKFIYLDPDICFFDSIGLIYDMLDHCEILLTPHLTQISNVKRSDAPESAWLSCGIFNLGFCGLRRGLNSSKMIDWWHNRLNDGCYIDNYNSYFTDQKWMDFLPSFFTASELNVTRHLGMNVAPWNFFERKVISNDDRYYVTPRFGNDQNQYPLIFVHYSGYNYSELKRGSVIQNNIPQLSTYEDIVQITAHYAAEIHSQSALFDSYINQAYTYNYFNNEDSIMHFHRRLYRGLIEKGYTYLNPFDIGSGTFHAHLEQHKMLIPRIDVMLDKVTKHNLKGIGVKLRIFNIFSRLIFKIIGYQNYILLIRLFAPFSRYESQVHLIDKKFDSDNIY